MSSSDPNSSILLTDTPEEIRRKITHYAFCGSNPDGTTNLEIDVPFQYLRFFLDDDEKLEEIRVKYGSGEMKVEEVKEILIKCLTDFLTTFQERRKNITDEDVRKFLEIRKINPEPKKFEVIRIAK
jgi:tryptophanyl-tRNA synthetase